MGDRTGLPRQRFRRHETGHAVGQPPVLGRGGRRAARGQVRRAEAGHSALSPSPESLNKLERENIYYFMCSVADPDPGSGAFLTPGSGIRDG
jgi:hypothetical protein